jgi:hypothetical protein
VKLKHVALNYPIQVYTKRAVTDGCYPSVMIMELSAAIFRDANILINIMVWGMRTKLQSENLLENLYFKGGQWMEEQYYGRF